MERLDDLTAALDAFFDVPGCGVDPGFDGFVGPLYDEIGFDWRAAFEPGFVSLLNGLMLRGADEVHGVWCAAFPSPEVFDVLLRDAAPGDLLFTHHPVDLRAGDPRGAWGAGFVPIPPETVARLRERRISVYVCHAPLDTNRVVGTGAAIVEALGGTDCVDFAPYGAGYAGIVCTIAERPTERLVADVERIFGIPYADVDGARRDRISRVAVLPGGGDDLQSLAEAERLGAHAYLAGEIHSRADNDYIRALHASIVAYAQTSPLSMIGVSHAASEHLVMETQMVPWLRRTFDVRAAAIREPRWWR